MRARKRGPVWHYSGDVNIEHGGMFYNLATWEDGYVECWRCQPCSDAGGPDNMYWIEHLSVSVGGHAMLAFSGVGTTVSQRRAHRVLHLEVDVYGERVAKAIDRIEQALACVGYDTPEMLADWDKRTLAERRHIVTLACVSYGTYDQESSALIRVGPPQLAPFGDDWQQEPEEVLRANTNLRKYVRAQCVG